MKVKHPVMGMRHRLHCGGSRASGVAHNADFESSLSGAHIGKRIGEPFQRIAGTFQIRSLRGGGPLP